MSHDLEFINAAWRLGDRFIPPFGTVCYVKLRTAIPPKVVRGMMTGFVDGLIRWEWDGYNVNYCLPSSMTEVVLVP